MSTKAIYEHLIPRFTAEEIRPPIAHAPRITANGPETVNNEAYATPSQIRALIQSSESCLPPSIEDIVSNEILFILLWNYGLRTSGIDSFNGSNIRSIS